MHIFKRQFLLAVLSAFMCDLAVAQHMPSLSPNHLVFDSATKTLHLRWLGDTLRTRFEPYAALLIPIELKGCPKRFYMQFDLGAPNSILYRDKIRQIRDRYPSAVASADTVALADFQFRLDNLPVVAKEIKLIENDQSVISWTDKKSITIIGTIGADLIDGRVAVIDYPAMKLSIGKEIPAKLKSKLLLTDMYFSQRRVLFPATLNEKDMLVFFDTGSSAYEFLTDQETAETLATDTLVERNDVTSWDRKLTANTLRTSRTIKFAGQTLPLRYVTYMEGVSSSQIAYMKRLGIGGMTGNKVFLNSILVLDTRRKKFGVVMVR